MSIEADTSVGAKVGAFPDYLLPRVEWDGAGHPNTFLLAL